MARIKAFLTVLCVAGCGGGGGGGEGGGSTIDGGGSDDGTQPDGGGPGSDGSGGNANAPANDHCANATAISINTMQSAVAATTAGASADLAAPCGAPGTPDVFFKFTLTRRELVYADTFGAAGNTALYFASSCSLARTAATTDGDAVCSTTACGTGQSQVVALLDPGTHYLVLAGSGAATIHFQHTQVGAGSVTQLPAGSSTLNGTTTSGSGTLYACDAGGAENAYWWRTCPGDAGGAFHSSTCTGTTWDTVMSMQMPGSDATLCDDDTCSHQSSVTTNIPAGAGLFVVSVDGNSQSAHGDYILTTSRP